jgi:polysaccharide biosynthesis/export protein
MHNLLRSLIYGCLIGALLPTVPAVMGQSLPSKAEPSKPLQAVVADPEANSVAAYLLGPGDLIDLRVFGYEEYTGVQVILPDGTITLPVIGTVLAAGQTPGQLTRNLTTRLKPLLVEALVSIRVIQLRPLLINVAGEVQRPGPLQLQGLTPSGAGGGTQIGTTFNAPTVSAAIAQAGGITKNADIRGVILKRYKPSGEAVTIVLNLWEALRSSDGTPDLLLRDGDTLFVPKARDNSELDPRLIARSTLAPKTVRVRVVGEVKAPGEREVQPNSTISSAVASAGGPTDKANLMAVTYVRLGDNGTIQKQGVDLSNLNDTIQVQDGDLVIVPKTDISSILDTASTIFNPLLLLRLVR